jgi:hypothetical protein
MSLDRRSVRFDSAENQSDAQPQVTEISNPAIEDVEYGSTPIDSVVLDQLGSSIPQSASLGASPAIEDVEYGSIPIDSAVLGQLRSSIPQSAGLGASPASSISGFSSESSFGNGLETRWLGRPPMLDTAVDTNGAWSKVPGTPRFNRRSGSGFRSPIGRYRIGQRHSPANYPYSSEDEAWKASQSEIRHPGSVYLYQACGLPQLSDSQQKTLYKCTQGEFPELWYKFKRFESLNLLNLYHYQHDLVKFQSSLRLTGVMDIKERQLLRYLMKEYRKFHLSPSEITQTSGFLNCLCIEEALHLFAKTSKMKRPKMKVRRKAIDRLQAELEDCGYTDAPDGLGMVDLSPKALNVEPDAIRVLLSRTFGLIMRSQTYIPGIKGIQQKGSMRVAELSNLEHVEERTPGSHSHRIRPYALAVSSVIDFLARFFIAVAAALFLLVPMVALSYIQQKEYLLITTCLFVLGFVILISSASQASNQEIITSTAAYAAVLVVFVGQTSSPVGS